MDFEEMLLNNKVKNTENTKEKKPKDNLSSKHEEIESDNCNNNFNCLEHGSKCKEDVCEGVKEIEILNQESIKKMQKALNKKIQELESVINKTRKIEYKLTSGEIVDTGNEALHEKFYSVMHYLLEQMPVMLIGDVGVGKTHMAQQIAKLNKWDYYFCNQVTEEYKIVGYKDANGNYHDTSFFNAFTKGGLFCIDEVDASIPEVIICLNMALANGKFNFPHGQFDMHPDFRVVACGNTLTGATSNFTGRSKLDKATLDRFVIIEMEYDIGLEKKLIDDSVVDLLIALRKYVNEEKSINTTFSTRCGIYYDKMKQSGMNMHNLVKDILLRGVELDDFLEFGEGSENSEIKSVRKAIYELSNQDLPESDLESDLNPEKLMKPKMCLFYE